VISISNKCVVVILRNSLDKTTLIIDSIVCIVDNAIFALLMLVIIKLKIALMMNIIRIVMILNFNLSRSFRWIMYLKSAQELVLLRINFLIFI
jgi:hypothetical protein